jgi:ATP-binding cassette, subfamily C, bacterial
MVTLLVVSGAMEAMLLAVILPILHLLLGEEAGYAEELIASGLGILGFAANLEPLIILLIIVAIGKSAVVLLAQKKVGDAVVGIGRTMRHNLVKAVSRANWSYFVSQSSGELSNSLTFEVENASNTYFHSARLLADIIVAGFYVASVAILSPYAALSAAVVAPVLIFLMRSLIHMAERSGRAQTFLLKTNSRVLIDLLIGFKVLKASGKEHLLVDSLARINDDLADAKRQEVFAKEGLIAIQQALVITLVAIGLYVFLTFFEGNSSELILVCFVFMRIMGRVSTIQSALQSILRCNAAYESFTKLVDSASQSAESESGDIAPSLNTEITVDDVSFKHGANQIFQNFNLKIPANSFIALIGPSGTGKTTFLDLIIGLQKPDSGQISIDGAPLSSVNMKAWRHMIAYVPQEPILLHDSIKNNLTLFQDSIPEEDIWDALSQVNLDNHVRSLPNGLGTSVGERGMALSGGQRQRLMIARALLSKPRLLVLDEVTSGLDRETEDAIWATIKNLKATKLAISHQPALRRFAESTVELSPLEETDNL